jgi:HK97 family phage major capsid protein
MKDKMQFRNAVLTVREAEGDKPASLQMSVSSEEPILSYAYFNKQYQRCYEILDHDSSSVDMTRCASGLVVLDGHGGDQIGLMDVSINERKLSGAVQFCSGERAQEIASDAVKGLRRNISVGYTVDSASYRLEGQKEGVPVVRAMRWMPYEASFVAVPADVTVGVGRAADPDGVEVNERKEKNKMKLTPKEMAELFERAAKYGVPADEVTKRIESDNVRAEIDALIVERQNAEIITLRERKPDVVPTKTVETPSIGLNPVQARQYSFLNVCRHLMGEKVDIGFERECSEAVSKKLGRAARGLFVPYDVQVARRDLQIAGGGTGANVVATNLLAGDFITSMRNAMALPALGVRVLSGLVGDIAIPKGGAATAAWIAETVAATETTPVLSQVTGSPKTVAATIDLSRKLMRQSSIDVEMYAQNEIAFALANAIDASAFNGAGTSEPTGLLTGPISTDVAMTAGSVTYADICSLISTVTGKNAKFENLRFAVTNEVFWKLAATATSTNGPLFIADYNTSRILGRPTVISENVTANYGFVADWTKMILGMWGNGLDLTVDPYTGSKSGLVSVTAFMDADIMVADANAFAHADITT